MKIAKIGSYSLNLIKKFPTPLRNITVTYGTQLLEKLPKSWSSRLYKEILLNHTPSSFLIEVTNTCNLRCPLCSVHKLNRKKKTLKFEELKYIVDNTPAIKHIGFYILGEPLLCRDLFKMVRYCSNKQITTGFSTNGMLIDKYIDEIFESGLDYIQITIDGAYAESHKKYRIVSYFKKVCENIEKLTNEKKRRNAKKPYIKIQTLVFKFNEHQLKDIIELTKRLGVDAINFKAPSIGKDDKSKFEIEKLMKEYIPENKSRYNRYSLNIKYYKDMPICPQLFNGYILSNGDVVPCCADYEGEYSFGNIFEEDFASIWKGELRKKFLDEFFSRNSNLCKKCDLAYGIIDEIIEFNNNG